MKNVFLSGPYGTHEDLSLLAKLLEDEGVEVRCPDHIQSGTDSSSSEEILSAIKRCDVFVAFLGKPHPNVMFELGYALGDGKAIVLIRTIAGEVPFEVASFPVLKMDSRDSRSIAEVLDRILQASVKSKPEQLTFTSFHEKLRHMCLDDSYLDVVEPREFEECIAGVLKEKGFEPELLPARNDKGFDIQIDDFLPKVLMVVEVRKQNRNSKLSIAEVQRIVGAAVFANAQHAILVTSGGFTSSAKFFAADSPVRVTLFTIDNLFELSQDDIIKRCMAPIEGK